MADRSSSDEKRGQTLETTAPENLMDSVTPENRGDSAETPFDRGDAADSEIHEAEPHVTARDRMKQTAVILTMVGLLVCLCIVVAAMPPLGRQPVSDATEGQFSLRRMTQLLTPGVEPVIELTYNPIGQEVRYAVSVTSEEEYDRGKPVKAEFRADMVLGPGHRGNARAVEMRLEHSSAVVFDGEESHPVAYLDTMMNGILMEGRLDPRAGMGRFVPSVKINPQTGRVIYLMSDVLRFAWPTLPEGKVGLGGVWNTQDHSSDGETVSITVTRQPEHFALQYERKAGGLNAGTGHGELVLREGEVISLHGSLVVPKVSGAAIGEKKHNVAFSLRRVE